MQKGAEAKADIEKNDENAKLTLMKLDLANLQSIEAFVEEFNEKELPLHVLVNNAGEKRKKTCENISAYFSYQVSWQFLTKKPQMDLKCNLGFVERL